ncbi:MAG TPA: DUF433 domain-containing protein [Tepidisphaeraceae bacterium]|nr:DUF433 domain-containing protein [Tepidisphaeraceae bacterium]
MKWQEHIRFDPDICHGKPTFVGTRIMVSVVLDNLADGVSEAELLESYPTLRPEHVRAAMAYAADLMRDRVLPLPQQVA